MLKKALQQERSARQSYEEEAKQYRDHGRDTWQNISDLQNMLQDKELKIQDLIYAHKQEIAEYQIKLQQRDSTLRKVLEAKMSQTSTKC